MGAGNTHRHDRRAHRRDAQRGRRHGQGGFRVLGDRAGLGQHFQRWWRRFTGDQGRHVQPHAVQIDMNGQSVSQALRNPFPIRILGIAFVEQHQRRRAIVDRSGQPRRQRRIESLRHRHHQRLALGIGQYAGAVHGLAAGQCRRQVQPAIHCFGIGAGRQAAGGDDQIQCIGPSIAYRAGAGAQQDASNCIAGRHQHVDRRQRQRPAFSRRVTLPFRGHAGISSAMARVMRAVEPVSSSTLRRRRWRSAMVATSAR